MKTGDLFYTNFGRVVHSYWGATNLTCVTDDFGNAVNLDMVQRSTVMHFCRQGDQRDTFNQGD